jgi:hypothetical protein
MPTKRSRLTGREQEEDSARRLQLQKLRIVTEVAEDFPPQPKRFILEPVDPDFARLFPWPTGDVAVVLPAMLTVLKSGVVFTDAAVFCSGDGFPLDIEDSPSHPYWDRLQREGPWYPPRVLNDLLVEKPVALRPRRHVGLIIATGWTGPSTDYDDNKRVTLEVWLKDEQCSEVSCDFTARVDRRFWREYERSRPDPSVIANLRANRVPLFESGNIEPSVQRDIAAEARTTEDSSRIGTADPPNTSRHDTKR